MRDKQDSQSNTQNDDAIARILKIVGKQEPLPAETKEKWAQAFAGEMNRVVASRRQSRKRRWAALSACAAITLVTVVWYSGRFLDPTAVPVARVVNLIGTAEHPNRNGIFEPIHEGYALAADDQLRTAAGGYVSLIYQGARVRLKEQTEVRFFEDYLYLKSGQIYVATDTREDGEAPGKGKVDIRTDIASVTDIGTQFMVSYDGVELTTMVRDGAIKVSLNEGEYTAHAGDGMARKIKVSQAREVSVTQGDRTGEEWQWTLLLAAQFNIEGRTAYEFLMWATGETGMRLVFEDQWAEANARETLLHGDLATIDPVKAIDLVLETTRLVAHRPDANTLIVSLRPR